MSSSNEVAVAGVGMHPWGKWGHNFVTYGVHAALAALEDAGIPWEDVGFVSGADTMRNGYPGYVAGATFAQALGWTGVPVTSSYGACASGAMAIEAARARILSGRCDVALVVGADTTPKGFLAPQGGERTTDPDWLRFRLLGATNPTYFGMYARRRIDLFGATVDDFTAVKLKNARHGLNNPYARYRKAFTAEDVAASPVVADGAAVTYPGAVDGADLVFEVGRQSIHQRCRTSQPIQRSATRCRSGPSSRASGTPPTRRPASAPKMSTSPRCMTCPPLWSSTGTRTWASASRARPRA